MAAMQHDNLKIEIEGSEIQELYNDLVSLEVELDEELAGMFRMNIALLLQSDGTWNYTCTTRSSAGKHPADWGPSKAMRSYGRPTCGSTSRTYWPSRGLTRLHS